MKRAPLPSTIRILLVDDHLLFRTGIALVLGQHADLAVVGDTADGAEALALARSLQPDIVLLDLCMPGMSGVATLKLLRRHCPDVCVLMLTGSDDPADLALALGAGAAGYLDKGIDGDTLAAALRRAVAGELILSEALTSRLVSHLQHPVLPATAAIDRLTPRERDVLAGLAAGDSNKTIARALGVAESTVKIHVQHVLKKLNLSSRVQAALLAVRVGIGNANESV